MFKHKNEQTITSALDMDVSLNKKLILMILSRLYEFSILTQMTDPRIQILIFRGSPPALTILCLSFIGFIN